MALDEVAARLEVTPAQVALAWLIAQPSVSAPIASATDLDQLAELVKANLRLDEAALAALNDASLER
jgi:aryl-alcohol dehydrogenase-like predicted oxidoreductase